MTSKKLNQHLDRNSRKHDGTMARRPQPGSVDSMGGSAFLRHSDGPFGDAGYTGSKERAVVELPFHAGITTSSGHIHAGSMVSLADTSATRRAVELVDMPVAVSISTQTVGNVQEGTLRSESTVAHPGRTLVVVTTRVTADGGKLLALVNSSHFVQQTDQGKYGCNH